MVLAFRWMLSEAAPLTLEALAIAGHTFCDVERGKWFESVSGMRRPAIAWSELEQPERAFWLGAAAGAIQARGGMTITYDLANASDAGLMRDAFTGQYGFQVSGETDE